MTKKIWSFYLAQQSESTRISVPRREFRADKRWWIVGGRKVVLVVVNGEEGRDFLSVLLDEFLEEFLAAGHEMILCDAEMKRSFSDRWSN
jgi:hypothetical protein